MEVNQEQAQTPLPEMRSMLEMILPGRRSDQDKATIFASYISSTSQSNMDDSKSGSDALKLIPLNIVDNPKTFF